MLDYYKILGIDKNADAKDVRKAFRELALKYHPDKAGSDPDKAKIYYEKMQLLNVAYETLGDTDNRKEYDAEWEYSAEAADAADTANRIISGHLDPNGEPYSQKFRQEYTALQTQYRTKPLSVFSENSRVIQSFNKIQQDFYKTLSGNSNVNFRDIYAFIYSNLLQISAAESVISINQLEQQSLTAHSAVNLLLSFLQGDFDVATVNKITAVLQKKILSVANAPSYDQAYPFYQSVLNILSYKPQQDASKNLAGLLPILEKITDYAQTAASSDSTAYVMLWQSDLYRHFFACVVEDYWQSSLPIFSAAEIKQFAGQETAKTMLHNMVRQLAARRKAGGGTETLKELVIMLNTLYRFEKDIEEAQSKANNSQTLRELGYRLLDWIPALMIGGGRSTLINTFLQAGMCFQRASQQETQSVLQMTDESMAFRLYASAMHIATYATPDINLYTSIHSLRYIGQLRYKEEALEHDAPLLQKRAMELADIFPMATGLRANSDWLVADHASIHLLRHYLNTLVDIIRGNYEDEEFIVIDQDYISVVYQAYEACLKGWYADTYEPETEEHVRTLLMWQMLGEQGWSFADLNKNLQPPYIKLDRNKEGWLTPKESLPLRQDRNLTVFTSIEGMEVNHGTGEIKFSLAPWQNNDPESFKIFTADELMQIMQRNLGAAIFSLDPVDPHRFYHPFNQQRVMPAALYQTQLHHTMLLTDYLLKFFTVGSEAQAELPYGQRPVDKMLTHVPEYLRKIIIDFQNAQHSDDIHRFWIEPEEVNVAIDKEGDGLNVIERFSLDNVRMLVKKHRMTRNAQGQIIDTTDSEEEHEGWHFYIYENGGRAPAASVLSTFKNPAIIFLSKTGQHVFWEGDASKTLTVHQLKGCEYLLQQVFLYPRDDKNRVIVTNKNSLELYYLTHNVVLQANKPHHFTPEYLFAQDFTAHYDEFSQYFPEFARLKQLSKMTVLTRILDGVKDNVQENITELQTKLNDTTYWQSRQRGIDTAIANMRQQLNEIQTRATNEQTLRVNNIFTHIQQDMKKEKKIEAQKQKLRELRKDIGELPLSSESSEVRECIEENIRLNKEKFIAENGWSSWNSWGESNVTEHFRQKKSEIARTLSEQKRTQIEPQLRSIFADFFDQYTLSSKINTFLTGSLESAISEIAEKVYEKNLNSLVEDIVKNNPQWSYTEVRNTIIGNSSDYRHLIEEAINYSLSNVRKEIQTEINRLQSIIPAEQAEIRKAQEVHNRFLKNLDNTSFAKQENVDELQGKCLWVPASITHTAQERGRRLVYGGVSIHPNLCIINPSNPLFEPIMDQSFNNANQQLVSITTLAAQARSAASATPTTGSRTSGGASAAGGGRRGGGGSSSGGGGGDDDFPGNSKPPKGQPRKFKVKDRKIPGFEYHHIISDKNYATKEHPLLKEAGFNLQSPVNRIYLPKHKDAHPTRSPHSGRHLQTEMDKVAESMDDILKKGKSASWTQQQYYDELRQMIRRFRMELKKGNIGLNAVKREHAGVSFK